MNKEQQQQESTDKTRPTTSSTVNRVDNITVGIFLILLAIGLIVRELGWLPIDNWFWAIGAFSLGVALLARGLLRDRGNGN